MWELAGVSLKAKLSTGRRLLPDKKTPSPRRAASVNRYLQDLKAVFSMAVRNGTLERFPFVGVELLPENNKRTREVTAAETAAEEAKLLLAVPPEPPTLRAFYAAALETGARAGELCALGWWHVSWGDGLAELEETKAGRKQHLVLSRRALASLRDLPRYGPCVFAWPDGRPFTVDFVSHAFRRAARRAGLANVRLHAAYLRHPLQAGRCGPVHCQGALRHASTRMAERYQHVTRQDLRAAVELGARSVMADRSA